MPIKHVVKQGECLSLIAHRHGFADGEALYHHPDNTELRKVRPNPNVLFPGDLVVIPDHKEKTVPVETGKMHRFTLARPKKVLRLVLKHQQGTPYANEPYVLELDGMEPIANHKTNGDGELVEEIPLGHEQATLQVLGRVFRLKLGGLNPMRDTPDGGLSGVKARLRNLGYEAHSGSSRWESRTRLALALFQADHDLDPTGEPDDTTLKKLEEQHRS